MDVQMDLGKRIVEAARLAVSLHMQLSLGSGSGFGGAGTRNGSGGGASNGVDAAPVGMATRCGGAGGVRDGSPTGGTDETLGLGLVWSRQTLARMLAIWEAA